MANRKPTESHEAAVDALYQAVPSEPFEYSCRLEIGEILRLHACLPGELREEIRKGLCTPPGPLMAKITNKEARYFPARNLDEPPDWELVFSRHEAPPNFVFQEPEIRFTWEDRRWMKGISVVLRPVVSDAVFFPDWWKVRDALKHPVDIRPPGKKESEKPKPVDQATIDLILKQRQDSIESFVTGMMEAAQKDSLSALPEQRIEAREVVWGFADVRRTISNEAMAFTRDYLNDGPAMKDINIRIARMALALYWLDALGVWSRFAADSKKHSLTALVKGAAESVGRILGPAYFQASNRDIINAFLDEEAILTACGKACSSALLPLHDAAEMYKDRVADLVEACEREMKPT